MGPCTLLFGPLVEKAVTVVQARLASGYLDLIDTIIAVTPMTVFQVFDSLLMVVTGTIALAFAKLISAVHGLAVNGALPALYTVKNGFRHSI